LSPDTGPKFSISATEGCAAADVIGKAYGLGFILKSINRTFSICSLGTIVLAGTAVSLSAIAQAIAPNQPLSSVVVTASRTETPIADALADVTVITRAMIEQSSARSFAQLLQQTAGIEIAETGGAVKTTGLFVRGTKTAQTLVLVDGVRIENAGSGGANIEFLNLDNIERIEVAKGPGSSSYGSAALGGVIQIFTRQHQGARVQAELGSFGSSKFNLGIGSRLPLNSGTDHLTYSIQAHTAKTNGYDATLPGSSNEQIDRDGSTQKGLNINLNASLRGVQIGLAASSNQGKSYYDDAFSTPETAYLEFKQQTFSINTKTDVVDRWTSGLRYGQSAIDYSYGAFEFAPKAKTQSIQWDNQVHISPRNSPNPHIVQFGWEQQKQSVRGAGVGYLTDERTMTAIWIGAQVKYQAHKGRLQLRQDRIESVGTATLKDGNYSLAYGYEVNKEWQISASSSSAFRAPTFDDLFSPFGGNASLKPEQSKAKELSLQHRSKDLDFSVTAFSQRIKNAIELDGSFVPQNSQLAMIDGLSTQWSQRFGTWRVNGQLTLQNPRFQTQSSTVGQGQNQSQQLARRAKQFASFGLANQFGPIKASANVLYQAKRVDSDGSQIKPYSIVNVGADYAALPSVNLGLRLVNLFDRAYETTSGYRGEPRGAYINLTWVPKF
jgi:vitamin B12 transporter